MVRLKAKAAARSKFRRMHFNSTMVRLKAKRLKKPKKAPKNFNSTMVRLKANKERHETGSRNVFQFHYGSIKGLHK